MPQLLGDTQGVSFVYFGFILGQIRRIFWLHKDANIMCLSRRGKTSFRYSSSSYYSSISLPPRPHPPPPPIFLLLFSSSLSLFHEEYSRICWNILIPTYSWYLMLFNFCHYTNDTAPPCTFYTFSFPFLSPALFLVLQLWASASVFHMYLLNSCYSSLS